ncbi:hypothetical protein BGP_0996 [Beggiatoa sp. PS]|nr:hypothetical protein BGP_0996 [Beggiatoa sp. PS]
MKSFQNTLALIHKKVVILSGQGDICCYILICTDHKMILLKKDPIYKEIEKFIKSEKGLRLGGSVFFIPLPDTETSEKYAITLWNKMSELLDGKLSQGDSFFFALCP